MYQSSSLPFIFHKRHRLPFIFLLSQISSNSKTEHVIKSKYYNKSEVDCAVIFSYKGRHKKYYLAVFIFARSARFTVKVYFMS